MIRRAYARCNRMLLLKHLTASFKDDLFWPQNWIRAHSEWKPMLGQCHQSTSACNIPEWSSIERDHCCSVQFVSWNVIHAPCANLPSPRVYSQHQDDIGWYNKYNRCANSIQFYSQMLNATTENSYSTTSTLGCSSTTAHIQLISSGP